MDLIENSEYQTKEQIAEKGAGGKGESPCRQHLSDYANVNAMLFAKACSHHSASFGVGGAGGDTHKRTEQKNCRGCGISRASARRVNIGHFTSYLFDYSCSSQHCTQGHHRGA
jgi:hypothetical protein